MTASAARLIEDLQRMLVDIDELAKRVPPESGAALDGEPCKVSALLSNARTKVSELKDSLVERVQTTDQQLHDNAWKSVGAAAAIAFVAGILVGRR